MNHLFSAFVAGSLCAAALFNAKEREWGWVVADIALAAVNGALALS
jgi:hypothetical protein